VGATHCVDIATLTGAQIIALGGSIGAVMSPKDTAAVRVITAGTKTGGEKWWQLPLEDSYFEQMKSKVRSHLSGCCCEARCILHAIQM
jgi:leucyl aminopeptidase